MSIQDWLILSPCSLRDPQKSPKSQFKRINSSVLSLLYGPTLISIHDYRKNHSFDYKDLPFMAKCLHFNTLSRFVIAFLSGSKCLLISWLTSLLQWSGSPRKENLSLLPPLPLLFAMKLMPWPSFFECWVVSQLFNSSLSLSSRGSLVPLSFLPLEWYCLHISSYWYVSWQLWCYFGIHLAWHFTWYTLHKS